MKALYPTPRICIRLPYETPSMNSCRKWSSRAVCCLLSILCRNARYTPCQMEKPCSDWIICVYNRLKITLPLCNSGRACKALIFFRIPYFSHYISFISYDMQIESVSYPFSVSLFTGIHTSLPFSANLILIRCIPHNVHVRRDIIFLIFLQPC